MRGANLRVSNCLMPEAWLSHLRWAMTYSGCLKYKTTNNLEGRGGNPKTLPEVSAVARDCQDMLLHAGFLSAPGLRDMQRLWYQDFLLEGNFRPVKLRNCMPQLSTGNSAVALPTELLRHVQAI